MAPNRNLPQKSKVFYLCFTTCSEIPLFQELELSLRTLGLVFLQCYLFKTECFWIVCRQRECESVAWLDIPTITSSQSRDLAACLHEQPSQLKCVTSFKTLEEYIMWKWLEILKILIKERIPTFFWRIAWEAAGDIWVLQGLWLEKCFNRIKHCWQSHTLGSMLCV